jgi:hypothetical protein
MEPDVIGLLHAQIELDAHAGLAARAPAEPGRVGAALPQAAIDLVDRLIRDGLDYLVELYGDDAEAYVRAHRDAIRRFIGEGVLEAADRMIHGLQGLEPAE